MPFEHVGLRRTLSVVAVSAFTAVFAAGCGGETTDISAAVDATNENLKANGVTLDCPKEVDGGEGTKVDCTLKGAKSGESAPLQVKVGKDSIVPVDEKKYEETVTRIGN